MGERPLWAPWRLQYVAGPKSGTCIFCAAVARDSRHDSPGDELVVDRGELCFTMLNAFPYAGGHLLVSPNRHVGDLTALDQAEVAEMMRMVSRALEALRSLMSPHGFNVGLNLGQSAGAGFEDHLHFHVVPRWTGDNNFMPVIADTRVIPQALDATAAALRRTLPQLDA